MNPNLILVLTAFAAFALGALVSWLLSRNQAQTQLFDLVQQLAETRRQHQFAEQTQQQAEQALQQMQIRAENLQNDVQNLNSRFAAACQQIDYLQQYEDEAAELRGELQDLRVQNERLHTQWQQERRTTDEKIALLNDARQSLSDQFHRLANDILEEKSRRFAEQNREYLGQLLNPLHERIHGFSELVQHTYEKESRERFTLETELKRLQTLNSQLHQDAKALTDALAGTQNKAQGNWGEMILENVLEHSGLQKGREYEVQAASTRREEDGTIRRLQPDVVIRLPDNKQIIIDSKVSLTAYVRYTQAQNTEEAARELAAHAASIRAHVKGLSAKNYSELSGIQTLDFVFMFIPVEPAYLIALQHDANLFQECFEKRIMLAGPSTLLATLRTVANLWRNEQQNQNALAIAEEGGRLYDKFVGFVQTLDSVGKNLDQAQAQFQTAYKQLAEGRGNLVSRAEKLRTLGVKANKQLDKQLSSDAQSEEEADKTHQLESF